MENNNSGKRKEFRNVSFGEQRCDRITGWFKANEIKFTIKDEVIHFNLNDEIEKEKRRMCD